MICNEYHVIANPTGGSGKGARVLETVKKVLDEKAIAYKVHETRCSEDIDRFITELEDGLEGMVRLLIIGGDGTVSRCINAMKDMKHFSVGIIPAGSGNDFLRGLGIKGDVKEILKSILSDTEGKAIDIGLVKYKVGDSLKQRRFAISSGLGFDALVCYRVNHSRLKKLLNVLGLGNLAYGIITFLTLITVKGSKASVTVGESEKKTGCFIYAAAMNTAYEGGGVMMAPNASATDRRLNLCLGHNLRGLGALPSFIRLVMKKHDKDRHFYLKAFKNCRIKSDDALCLHADGECVGFFDEVEFDISEDRLKVFSI